MTDHERATPRPPEFSLRERLGDRRLQELRTLATTTEPNKMWIPTDNMLMHVPGFNYPWVAVPAGELLDILDEAAALRAALESRSK